MGHRPEIVHLPGYPNHTLISAPGTLQRVARTGQFGPFGIDFTPIGNTRFNEMFV